MTISLFDAGRYKAACCRSAIIRKTPARVCVSAKLGISARVGNTEVEEKLWLLRNDPSGSSRV